jgi:hypothetical protein
MFLSPIRKYEGTGVLSDDWRSAFLKEFKEFVFFNSLSKLFQARIEEGIHEF